jgi:hypothetical protein
MTVPGNFVGWSGMDMVRALRHGVTLHADGTRSEIGDTPDKYPDDSPFSERHLNLAKSYPAESRRFQP